MSMYNYCDDTVHYQRRKCSTSPAVGVQLERYIQHQDFFIKTQKKISEIDIDESVFKTFHQNLIQLTSTLKENNNAPA